MRNVFRWFLGVLVLPVTVASGIAQLVRFRRELAAADVVIVMDNAGFGHTITGPEAARRQFSGQRIAFIVLSEYGRHNRHVGSIWPDVSMIFIGLNIGWRLRDRRMSLEVIEAYRHLAAWTIEHLWHWRPRPRPRVIRLMKFYEELPFPPEVHHGANASMNGVAAWNLSVIRLIRDVPAARVGLPPTVRAAIRCRLRQLAAAPEQRLCCLYLRRKGVHSPDITNSRRVGSPLEAYLDGVRVLLEAGYQVLLTGDLALPPALFQAFGGQFVDAAQVGVSEALFNVFAATEADICVGEVGGGTWLPGVNRIPRLVLNAFPFFYGYPFSWMYYKQLIDASGRHVPLEKLFTGHAYDWEAAGLHVHSNTSEEISEAIAAFLGDLAHPENASPLPVTFPEHTWIYHAGARLSPAWLRRVAPASAGLAAAGSLRA